MANLMDNSFYPHGKPGYFAYTKHFVEEFGYDTGYLAKQNTSYPGLNGEDNQYMINRALKNLDILKQGARDAELAFIKDTGIDLKDPNSSKDIFNSINKIFNSKETFERGMKYMKELANPDKKHKKDQMYRDVTRYFASYLGDAVHDTINDKGLAKKLATMTKPEIESLVNDIIGNALIIAYTRVKDFINEKGEIRGKFGKYHQARTSEGEKTVQAITDMIKIIEDLQSIGAFKQFGYLFDMDPDTLMKNDNQGLVELKKKNYRKAKVDTNYGGNALELITSVVAPQLVNMNIKNKDFTIVSRHTGQDNKMKADTMLFFCKADVEIDDYIDYVDTDGFDKSIRMQNVDALQKYYQKLESSVEHVIAISDKNYSIKSEFDGINAQEKMDLQHAGMMLNMFGVDQIPLLINYLANCGSNDLMVQGKMADIIRTELQTYIGYFLFDNLQVETKNRPIKANVVNLMNVSGIYIPLSVFLEGLYNSIKDAAGHPSSLVSVTISLGGPTEQNVWTVDTWGAFREEHEKESFISYRILKNIADFLTGLV